MDGFMVLAQATFIVAGFCIFVDWAVYRGSQFYFKFRQRFG